MPTYTKQHLKIFQQGQVIFDQDVYVCLEGQGYCNSEYYFHRDRNMRSIDYKANENDQSTSAISLGVGDTVLITNPIADASLNPS